jgi:hypothetical protein
MPTPDETVIRGEWKAAHEHVGLDPTRSKLCFVDAADGNALSVHYPPVRELGADEMIDDSLAAVLNEPAHRDLHRVVVLDSFASGEIGRAKLAALLRHELEHARQWECWGDVPVELSCLFDEVISELVAKHPESGRQLYRAQPNERDANAAASDHLRRRFPDEVIERMLAGGDYVLAATKSMPEPLESLPLRNVVFLFQFHDVCRRLAERDGESFADRLERITPAARAAWEELEQRLERWA